MQSCLRCKPFTKGVDMISGKTLTDWGYPPGPWFKEAIAAAEKVRASGGSEAEIRAEVDKLLPVPSLPLRAPGERPFHLNIHAEDPAEAENIAQVEQHMAELMRVPTVVAGAVMPDACSVGGQLGNIPVGGVVATRDAIHPGMHSADICCSMAMSAFWFAHEPSAVLDAAMALSHFGGGGRPRGNQIRPPADILTAFEHNPLLAPLVSDAIEHFATQGDGNHFFYLGRHSSTGQLAIVTHHGSRKPGAMLYKSGMQIAERWRRKLSPETPAHNAWIPADSQDGEMYWSALRTIRAWTKASHFAIHDMVLEHIGGVLTTRFWNEHNFVFRRSDGLFYHGKGATPAWRDFADDSIGLTLIPLNMAEPILIARGLDAPHGLGFAPHGAGRNFSRTAFVRQNAGKPESEIVAEQTQGIDARFFCGVPDISELPGAYKSAATVRAQIAHYGLADVVDTIDPIGSIMAGDWQRDAPWRRKRSRPTGSDEKVTT